MTPLNTIRTPLFSDNLAGVLDFLLLQDKHNIPTLSLNIKLICTLRNRLEKLDKGSFFYPFLKLLHINFIFTDNIHILYIYPLIYASGAREITSNDMLCSLNQTFFLKYVCKNFQVQLKCPSWLLSKNLLQVNNIVIPFL